MRRMLFLITALAALGATSPAHAGTFVVHSCKAPDGSPLPSEGWKPVLNGGTVAAANECASGGALRAHAFAGAPRGNFFGWQLDVPEPLTLVRYALRRTVHNVGGSGWFWNYSFFENDVQLNAGNLRETCWWSSGCVDVDGTYGPNDTRTRRLVAFTDCSSGGGDCQAGGAFLQVHRAELTVEDLGDPAFGAAPSGGLFDTSAPLSGTEEASFSATDGESGVAHVALEVDGEVKTLGSVTCAQPYASFTPCKTQTSGTLAFDTTTIPDGAHRLRLLVYDATLTNVGVYGPVDVTVRNQAPPPECRPADGSVTLLFGRSTRRTVSYGRTAAFNGRALQADGSPAAGQPVVIRTSRAGEAVTVTARADGTFSGRLPAGPSRTVHATLRQACSKAIELRVRASARLRAGSASVRNGRAARFSGTVVSGPVPRRKLVLLQARSPRTGRWTTLRTVRADGRGRFRASYRFRRTFRRTTFRFRALVPAESGFPYVTGASRSVTVTVRP